MRVDWAIPCRHVEVHDNLATIVGAGIDHIWLPSVPAPVQVSLAIRLVFVPDELDPAVPHNLRVAAISPDRQTLAEVDGALNVAVPPGVADDWLRGLHVPMVIQFMAESEGRYSLEITVDGHTMGVPMNIGVRPPPTPAAPGPEE